VSDLSEKILVTVLDEGVEREATLGTGRSLLSALQSSYIPIGSVCGGQMSCGTCHVYLPAEAASGVTPDPDETELLEDGPGYRPGHSRLACQVIVTAAMDGMIVEIAPEI